MMVNQLRFGMKTKDLKRRYGLYGRSKNKLSIEIIKLYNFIKQRNIYEIIKKINTKR